jgi:hypothetical protein
MKATFTVLLNILAEVAVCSSQPVFAEDIKFDEDKANFNDRPATFTELVEAQNPQDDKIPDASRVEWDKTGFTLAYFGYKPGEYGGSADSPKPGKYKFRLNFTHDNLTQVK